MNGKDIMKLEGVKLSRLVADKLHITVDPIPEYADDLLAAFELVERMCLNKYDQRYLPFRLFRSHNGSYKADFSLDGMWGFGYGTTAPQAICRALLDTLRDESDHE